jgi:hypothetical protein
MKVPINLSIEEDVKRMGREAGLNFSQILEKSIIEWVNNPEREIQRYESEIIKHEEHILNAREEIAAIKESVRLNELRVLNEVVELALPFYDKYGMVEDKHIRYYSTMVNKSLDEAEDEIVRGLKIKSG